MGGKRLRHCSLKNVVDKEQSHTGLDRQDFVDDIRSVSMVELSRSCAPNQSKSS